MSTIRKVVAIIMVFFALGMISLSIVSLKSIETMPQLGEQKKTMENGILVSFKKDVSANKAISITKSLSNCAPSSFDAAENGIVANLGTGNVRDQKALIQKYEKNPDVAYVQPNYLYETDTAASASNQINDPKYDAQWSIKKIDADDAWNFIKKKFPDNKKVKVAVLDMGANLDHEDLQKALIKKNCVSVKTFKPGAAHPNIGNDALVPYTKPLQYHGTLVSGVIAATSNNGKGVAGMTNNLAELMVLNVFRYRDGPEDNRRLATSEDIARCINYAADHGAKVINMSIGNSIGSQSATNDKLLEKTIERVTKEKNVTVICSAGNSKSSTKPWYPSDFPSTISVIATDNYSSAFAKCKSSFSNYGRKKTLSAPGRDIYTTKWNRDNRTYGKVSGTSVAAPIVSSVAAMMYYVNPDISADEVRKILCDTATDLYTKGWDIYTGYGNVNAYAAVAKAAGVSIKRPPLTLKTPTVSVTSSGVNRMTLKWNKIPKAEGYKIYRATSAKGHYKHINTIKGKFHFNNNNLKHGKRYHYKVQAYGTIDNKKAYSSLSISRSNYPAGKVSSFRVRSYNYRGIKLYWDRVYDASGYKIYRATSRTGKYKQVKRVTNGTTTSWKDMNLRAGKRYYYKIKAYKNSTNGSISQAFSTKAVPAKPSIKVSLIKNKSAKLKWAKCSSVTGYKIYRANSAQGKYIRIGTTKKLYYIDNKRKKSKQYYYRIYSYKKVNGRIFNSNSSDIKVK